MSRPEVHAAIARLAALFEYGALEADSMPAVFLDHVSDEIASLRAQLAAALKERDANLASAEEWRRVAMEWEKQNDALRAAIEAERDRLAADLTAVCARESRALDEYAKHRGQLEAKIARLAAALEPTDDNLGVVWAQIQLGCGEDHDGYFMAKRILAAIRARAGLVTKEPGT